MYLEKQILAGVSLNFESHWNKKFDFRKVLVGNHFFVYDCRIVFVIHPSRENMNTSSE